MQPYLRFRRCIFEWEATLLNVVGHNILDPNYRRDLVTYSLYILIGISLVSLCYGILYYDLFTKIICLVGLLISIQVMRNLLFKILYPKMNFFYHKFLFLRVLWSSTIFNSPMISNQPLERLKIFTKCTQHQNRSTEFNIFASLPFSPRSFSNPSLWSISPPRWPSLYNQWNDSDRSPLFSICWWKHICGLSDSQHLSTSFCSIGDNWFLRRGFFHRHHFNQHADFCQIDCIWSGTNQHWFVSVWLENDCKGTISEHLINAPRNERVSVFAWTIILTFLINEYGFSSQVPGTRWQYHIYDVLQPNSMLICRHNSFVILQFGGTLDTFWWISIQITWTFLFILQISLHVPILSLVVVTLFQILITCILGNFVQLSV